MHHMVTELKISRCQLREISNHSSKHLSLTRETFLYSLLRKECTVSLYLLTIFVNFSFTATLWDVELGRSTLGWETWHHKEHLTTDHTMDLYDPNKCWIHSHEHVIFTRSYCYFLPTATNYGPFIFIRRKKNRKPMPVSCQNHCFRAPPAAFSFFFFFYEVCVPTCQKVRNPPDVVDQLGSTYVINIRCVVLSLWLYASLLICRREL